MIKVKKNKIMKKIKGFAQSKHNLVIFIAIFTLISITILFISRAASPSFSIEPESTASNIQSPATIIDDANASGGKAIQFNTPSSGRWQPALNSPFMWLLARPLNTASASDMGTGVTNYLGNPAPDPLVYSIDGFDNPASTVTALHGMGKKVICYLSAGSWEDWRSDAGSFPDPVKGSNLDGWPGERWLDVRQISILGPIMQKRMDMCKSKGFDAVEFDNVDGYSNDSGFDITATEQITYNKYLATQAHNRGLSAALKNDVDQIPSLWQDFDFAVNEQCNQYDECRDYKTYFIDNNKAVFQIEYSVQQSKFCPTMNTQNFNSLLMPLNLDGGRKPCR